jgi:hypothetical protein
MPSYPVEFTSDRFPNVPAPVDPTPPEKKDISGSASTNLGGSIKLPRLRYARVMSVWLQEVNGNKQSIPVRNHGSSAYSSASDAGKLRDDADSTFTHFHFVPGVDEVEIRWDVKDADLVSGAKFEIWSAADDSAPIWSREEKDAEAKKLIQGDEEDDEDDDPTGPLAWDQVVIPNSAKFPDGCPNVANAPYQLRLTIKCSLTGAVNTAWTHFDILVHSIDLHWGPEAWIPNAPINNVSNMLQARTTADEKKVLQRLKGKVLPADVEQTPIPDNNTTISVCLPSTMAAYGHYNEWFGWGKDFAYLRHKARWGDGPRIPIQAKIYLLGMAGAKLDPDNNDCTWDQAGAALGPAKFLWDWRDLTKQQRKTKEDKRWTAAGDFVMRAIEYKMNTGDEPPYCRNCHIDRGGKRGGADRIFPNQTGTDSLPFVVTQGTVRKWAAFSTAKSSGPNACQTGVLFNPSRMAMDNYCIVVVLANQLKSDRSKPILDKAGRRSKLLADYDRLPRRKVPPLQIVRLIKARYIRKANYPAINLNLIDRSYRVAGLHIEWLTNAMDPNHTGFWTQADYNQCLTDAINMGGAHFSDQQILGRRFTSNAGRGRPNVQEDRYRIIQGLVNKNLLGNYDHWFGCPAGANPLPGQPSDTCFTFPARDVIVDPILDQAIQDFINKPRRINGVLRAWNQFLNNNGGNATPAVRLQFYQQLSQARQTKIDDAAKLAFRQARWQNYDNLDPNAWVASNFSHMNGTVDLLAEMHQLKIAADNFEGVTFYHYINIMQTLESDGTPPDDSPAGDPTGRYYGLGGVAKCDTSFDLGLKSIFFVWDHPDDGRRGRAMNPQIQMMNGNVTAVHEFGHNLHLTHPFGTDGPQNRDMHDKNPAERPEEDGAPGPADRCVMNYHRQDRQLCGACRLRLRGWARFKTGALEGFDVTNPANAGQNVRNSGSPYYNQFFADLG